MKRIFLILAIIAVFALVGCNRSASTPPAGGEVAASPTAPFPEPNQGSGQDLQGEMGTLAAGGFATLTAQASESTGGGQSSVVVETPAPEAVQPEATQVQQVEPQPVEPQPVTTEAPAPEPTSAPVVVVCTSPYTVEKGEWVYSIGRKCNIDPNAIITANRLVYPYTLYPGDQLILPANAAPFPGQ